ncbi:MAG: hypothetical protein ACLFUE_05355 [Desulfobacteraceae bacterium]
MISINATLVVQVIQFLLMVFILNRLMLRPIMRKIQEREQHIIQARKDSEAMASKAEELAAKRASIEAEARRKASHERYELKRKASEEAEGIFEESRKEVAAIREKINREIQVQMEKAMEALNQEAAALAMEIAHKVAGRRMSN